MPRWPRLTWILLLAAGIMFAGCSDRSVEDNRPVIAVSIYPVSSLVDQLTHPWADVVTLLPQGAEEHDFETTADQVRQLSKADLLVLVGDGLDPWAEPKPGTGTAGKPLKVLKMGDLIRSEGAVDSSSAPAAAGSGSSPSGPTPGSAPPIATSAADSADTANLAKLGPPPTPLPDKPGSNNHLWLDPVLALRFVKALTVQLSQRYPDHRKEIEQAAHSLTADLEAIDRSYRHDLANARRRELITYHNAFDLIANRYGLKIVARLTDIEADPHGGITPDSYLNAIRMIKKYNLLAIYTEPEFNAEEVDAIRRQTGIEVLTLDPLGGPRLRNYRTYQEMMQSNLKTLVEGQGLTGSLSDLPPLTPADGIPSQRVPGSQYGSQFGSSLRVGPDGMPLQRRTLTDPSLGLPSTVPPYQGSSPLDSQLPDGTLPSRSYPNQPIPSQYSPSGKSQSKHSPYGS